MQNSENDPLSLPFASKNAAPVENKLIVAATVAAVVLAGSAIAYRHVATIPGSTMRLFRKDSRGFDEDLENEKNAEGVVGLDAKIGIRAVSTSTTTYATGQVLEQNASNNALTSKSSRSKDRRKRGKDPLREAQKYGKKLKTFLNPTGSPSIPSSPTPPPAMLSSSPVGKEKQLGEMYSSFETGSSTSTHGHLLDASQDTPRSQRNPTNGIQREKTHATHTPTRDVSQPSCSSHDGEEDLAGDEGVDFQGTSSCMQYHIQSPNSLSQSSLSLPRSPSSLADLSEDEQEDGGWVTSVSKSRSKHRVRLENMMFEDIRTGSGGLGYDGVGNQAEDEARDEETKGYTGQGPDVADLSLRASCSDTNSEIGDGHQRHNTTSSRLPLSPIDLSSEKQKLKARRLPMLQGSQKEQTELSVDHGTRHIGSNEQPQFQSGGSSGTYTSFSSAVTGGGGGDEGRIVIGQRQTVSVTAAAVGSRRSSILAETDDVSGARPSQSTRAEDGEMEFTFPTLNSQATTSPSASARARSSLIDTGVGSSSPSKKNKRFSSNKNGTPHNAPPSRTSSPSNTRENYTTSYSQGPNANGASTPALSAQTQLASLRGALEAARLREEKHKTEMEKAMKELEMLKWESTNNRRGEVELQAQVQQLTHQLHSYAALFVSVAPHLNSHFALQLQPQVNGSPPDLNPGSSPNTDPAVELPNGGVDSSTSESPENEKLELQVAETQDEEVVSSSDKAQGQDHIPASPPTLQTSELLSPASHVDDVSSPLTGAQLPISPPPVPTFFPYYMPAQHPHYPVHHPPWMYHHYQPQQSTQNVSGTAGGPSSPPPPRHYTNVYSPTMYPISPAVPPLSPQGIGMTSPQLLHQYHPFGFGGGLRSTGASSAGSHSPELTGSTSGLGPGLNKPRPRMRRRKSQIAKLNANARAGWEDVGDGWIGLSKVVLQPTTSADKGRTTDEGTMADGEGEDDNMENASSPYSEILADAILKRSSTIRPSKKNYKKEIDPLVSQEGAEEVEEFSFPSLSDTYYHTASRTESSISSSLSSSPPSTTATVPDLIGDPGWEDDKTSLPPVIEKAEDSDPFVSDAVLPQGAGQDIPLSKIKDILIDEQATPKQEDHEQSSTDSFEQ